MSAVKGILVPWRLIEIGQRFYVLGLSWYDPVVNNQATRTLNSLAFVKLAIDRTYDHVFVRPRICPAKGIIH